MPAILSDSTAAKLNSLLNNGGQVRSGGYQRTFTPQIQVQPFHVRTLDPRDPDYDDYVEIYLGQNPNSCIFGSGIFYGMYGIVYNPTAFNLEIETGGETVDVDAGLTPTNPDEPNGWYRCKLAKGENLIVIISDKSRQFLAVGDDLDAWALIHENMGGTGGRLPDNAGAYQITQAVHIADRIQGYTNGDPWLPDKINQFWEGYIFCHAPTMPFHRTLEGEPTDINPSTEHPNGMGWEPNGIDIDEYTIDTATPATFTFGIITYDAESHRISIDRRNCILSWDGRINGISEATGETAGTVAEGVYP